VQQQSFEEILGTLATGANAAQFREDDDVLAGDETDVDASSTSSGMQSNSMLYVVIALAVVVVVLLVALIVTCIVRRRGSNFGSLHESQTN
jgi:flagellar biosynthesis/type III secretory pathway M-ring protein FliF/YscJ